MKKQELLEEAKKRGLPVTDAMKKQEIEQILAENPQEEEKPVVKEDRRTVKSGKDLKERRRKRLSRSLTVNPEDAKGENRVGTITEDEEKLVDIKQSQINGKILTGTVNMTIERGGRIIPIIRYGKTLVYIDPQDFFEHDPDKTSRKTIREIIDNRMGSVTPFVIKRIEKGDREGEWLALGDRLTAMKKIRDSYWNAVTRSGEYVLREGTIHEARVVSSIRSGIWVDMFGVETFIPDRHLDYSPVFDATKLYKNGDVIKVKIIEASRSKNGTVSFLGSVKETKEKEHRAKFESILEGAHMPGTVKAIITNEETGAEPKAIVALELGEGDTYDCLCKFRDLTPKKGDNVRVAIEGKDDREGKMRVFGVILHVTRVQRG